MDQALGASPTARLVLGGPDEAVASIEGYLSRRSRQRLIGRVRVSVSAPVEEAARAALDVVVAATGQHEAEIVEDLRQRVAFGQGGVVGLEATLGAVEQRRVGTLLISNGFGAPGARCPACGHLGVATRSCTRCGATNMEVGDIVELAIEEGLAQHAAVEFCSNDDLERLGRIGAIERSSAAPAAR